MTRYDIRPDHGGGWVVIDTRNGSGPVARHPDRESALRDARRRETPARRR